jgi:hypothetical protein
VIEIIIELIISLSTILRYIIMCPIDTIMRIIHKEAYPQKGRYTPVCPVLMGILVTSIWVVITLSLVS